MSICRTCCRRALGTSPATFSARAHLRPLPRIPGVATQLRPFDRRQITTAAAVASQGSASAQDDASKAVSVATRAKGSTEKELKWRVKKHLEFVTDNFRIAELVQKTLERGAYDEALMLVREASREGDLSVSWNYLIDYQMRQQKLHAAVKLYNEMKKRGQVPSARTYTVLFRGFANSVHPKLAVSESIRIYHSMLSSKRLQPNTIHMNAVLEVCWKAGDTDSMFSIVSTADEAQRSPDNRTYTIILNALRPQTPTHAMFRRRDEEDHEQNAEIDAVQASDMAAINQAKAIWEEVIAKWRKAKLVIDERLVCAMGRMLRQGGRTENEEILDLVEQTMNVPRQDGPQLDLPTSKGSQTAQSPQSKEADGDKKVVVRAKPQRHTQSKPRLGYVTPGNMTLSLILGSLIATRKTTLGPKYWDLLVNTYKIQPDQENYHSYLRLLRVGRASKMSAEVIEQMPTVLVAPKTFRIGLSSCIKDNLNPNAFQNATRIFKSMSRLRRPDAQAMRLYLQATRANYRHYKRDEEGKFALGRQIVEAINNMWEPCGMLLRSFSFTAQATKSPKEVWDHSANERMEAVSVARRMIAAMDLIATERAGPEHVVEEMKRKRNILNRPVTRFFEKQREMEGKFDADDEPGELMPESRDEAPSRAPRDASRDASRDATTDFRAFQRNQHSLIRR